MNDDNRPKKSSSGQKKRKGKDDDFQWRKVSRAGFIWVIIIGAALLLAHFYSDTSERTETISFNDFQKMLDNDNIRSIIVVVGETPTLIGETHRPVRIEGEIGREFTRFELEFTDGVPYALLKEWAGKNINITTRRPSNSWTLFLWQSPWLILIILYFIFARRLQGGGGNRGIFSFGKSRAKLVTEDKTKVTFSDVAGADEAKQELQEIIEFLKEPAKFQRLGGKIPKGALLLGPPGTGKTLLAKAIAGEADVPFLSMSGADFVEMFVGVGASRVRDLFETGRKHAPCIIFIDEIDAVGRHRGAGLGGGHDEREQTLNQLLVEMDGFDTQEGVILIAATNRPDVLDSALLRPGRFDRQIVVDRPDMRGREGILKVHTKKVPLAKNIKLDVLAKGTPGLSGADLANLVNEAALLAARRNRNMVMMDDFEDAKDKVMMGMERKTLLISDEEKKSTAYHEAGHAMVASFVPQADPLHKVTIIPRGRALGVTAHLPDERHTFSKEYLNAQLVVLLGGRAAEKLVFNQLNTGAGNDIERASDIARKMVCEWGMSNKLGPVTFGKKHEEIFLGREISQHRDYSESTAQEIDREVSVIVLDAQKQAEDILNDKIDLLHVLAEALLEHEILDGEQINRILNGEDPVSKTTKKSDK
jgi:cell division protease FtsH